MEAFLENQLYDALQGPLDTEMLFDNLGPQSSSVGASSDFGGTPSPEMLFGGATADGSMDETHSPPLVKIEAVADPALARLHEQLRAPATASTAGSPVDSLASGVDTMVSKKRQLDSEGSADGSYEAQQPAAQLGAMFGGASDAAMAAAAAVAAAAAAVAPRRAETAVDMVVDMDEPAAAPEGRQRKKRQIAEAAVVENCNIMQQRQELEDILARKTHPLSDSQMRDLKRRERQLKNRISAFESREKKKKYVENLETEVVELRRENELLKEALAALNRRDGGAVAAGPGAIAPEVLPVPVGVPVEVAGAPRVVAPNGYGGLVFVVMIFGLFSVQGPYGPSIEGSVGVVEQGGAQQVSMGRVLLTSEKDAVVEMDYLPPPPPPEPAYAAPAGEYTSARILSPRSAIHEPAAEHVDVDIDSDPYVDKVQLVEFGLPHNDTEETVDLVV